MEGSILSRFQLDMGLSRQSGDSDSELDAGSGRSWASSDERVQHGFPERAPSTDSELEDTFPFTPAQLSCAEFAEKACTQLGLAPDALAEFSQMRHADMIIELRASIMSLKQESQKDETRKYIASDEFKDVLKERLRCCLLSPNLTGYVIGTASNILEYAKKNIATFKIPEKATQDPEMLDDIATMVKELLTSQRSNIKQKLANSMKSKSHISLLARTLAPGNHFEITLNHWARFAFLRSSMVTFNHLVHEGRLATVNRDQPSRNTNTNSNGANEPGTEEAAAAGGTATADEVSTQTSTNGKEKIWTSNEFWEFVDTLLSQTRASAVAHDSTVRGQQKFLETMLTQCLQADMKSFPPSPSQSSTPSSEKVTLPWLRDINNNLIWTNP
ncbi:hypothetical protein HD554DRAFT_2174414 [Boletus coccyginus]|nr:hypothetical protein HD554DRAFT_2174414 [Boletus coccyginus]